MYEPASNSARTPPPFLAWLKLARMPLTASNSARMILYFSASYKLCQDDFHCLSHPQTLPAVTLTASACLKLSQNASHCLSLPQTLPGCLSLPKPASNLPGRLSLYLSLLQIQPVCLSLP